MFSVHPVESVSTHISIELVQEAATSLHHLVIAGGPGYDPVDGLPHLPGLLHPLHAPHVDLDVVDDLADVQEPGVIDAVLLEDGLGGVDETIELLDNNYDTVYGTTMGRWEKLLAKARTAPTNVTFEEVCRLAEMAGFIRKRSSGSHVWFRHPEIPDGRDAGISLQEGKNGKAKAYQVRQLLARVDDYCLGPGEE